MSTYLSDITEHERTRRRQQRLESLRQNVERRGYSVNQWCFAHDRSRATCYKLMRSGELKYIELAGRRFILKEFAEALLHGGAS